MATVAGLAASVALVLGLYRITIDKQELLVAERAVRTVYAAEVAGEDIPAALQREGIVTGEVQYSGTLAGYDLKGATVEIPRKEIESAFGEAYPIRVTDQAGNVFAFAVKINAGERRSYVEAVEIIPPERAKEAIGDVTFFDAGTL